MIKIIVDSEETKQAILDESEYIHYLSEIDSEKANTLMHMYMNPDMIVVQNYSDSILGELETFM